MSHAGEAIEPGPRARGDPSDLPPLPSFSLARLPRIEFGFGRADDVPQAVARHGRRVLIVSGQHSFRGSDRWDRLVAGLADLGVEHETLAVRGEPSPDLVQEAADDHRSDGIEVVLGIGGGSVLDAAKAIAGLLRAETTVFDHLEGVGPELPYRGPSVPFIAVPTTAGTGSEATKNAVLTRRGPDGYKKSFRDEQLVARETIVDPALLAGCPPSLIAADGLDALTQLLESYVSSRAGPFTDALALSGMGAARDGLLPWFDAATAGAQPELHASARSRMAYSALLSGICLAQAGLGAVHGLASPLGAYFPIPHGMACGIALAPVTRMNIAALEDRSPQSIALARYAELGRLLGGSTDEALADRDRRDRALTDADARRLLVDTLQDWSARLGLPGLRDFGVGEADVAKIVAGSRGSSMKTNPIVLTDDEIAEIVRACL